MSYTSKTTAAALAFSLILGGASAAFAKAHDQGVADGDHFAGQASELGGTGPIGPGGVSGGQKNGLRGDIASGNGGGNAVDPVERPGQNEPL